MERITGRTVVVTGAGGFIGPVVVRTMLDYGADVRALVGAPGMPVRTLAHERLQNIAADITDVQALSRLVQGADVVVHMAGPASVAGSFENPAEYSRIHITGTVALLEACRKAAVRKFVYVSSAEVYGLPQAEFVNEEHPLAPRSPYAAAKASAEHFVRCMGGFEIPSIILRPFSVYGPGVAPASLIGTILRMARSDEAICLHDLRPVRDYCYVDDLSAAVAKACATATERVIAINVGGGQGTSVSEVVKTALSILGRDIPIREDTARRRPDACEILRLVADRARASEILNWQPSVNLEDGLRRCV